MTPRFSATFSIRRMEKSVTSSMLGLSFLSGRRSGNGMLRLWQIVATSLGVRPSLPRVCGVSLLGVSSESRVSAEV